MDIDPGCRVHTHGVPHIYYEHAQKASMGRTPGIPSVFDSLLLSLFVSCLFLFKDQTT